MALGAQPARAEDAPARDESDACFSAAERAQPLMKQHRLREARAELETCARDACPRVARSDCREWLAQLTREQPTVLVAAHEVRGAEVRDVHGVRAVVDGAIVLDDVDAIPMPLDPGRHRVRLTRAGAEPLEQEIDVRDGDRQVVHAYWRAPTAVETPSRPTPTAVYVTGAAGIAAVAAGAALEIAGLTRRGELDATCRPTRTCAPSDVDAAHNLTLAGDLTVGGGLLLLAGAGVLYFARPVAPAATVSSARRTLPGWSLSAAAGAWSIGVRARW